MRGNDNRAEAQKLLIEAFARFMNGVQAVAGARAAAETALTEGGHLIADAAQRKAADGLRIAIEEGIVRSRRNDVDVNVVFQEVIENAADHQLTSLRAAVDASALIFTHSFLETAVIDLCRATMIVAPESWASKVESRTVRLADVEGRSYQGLLAGKLSELADEMEHDPLPKNVGRLLSVLRPEPGYLSGDGFKFSMPRLEELDRLRHQIVHHTGAQLIEDIGNALLYLQGIFFRLWSLVMHKYEVVLDAQLLRQAFSIDAPAAEAT